MQVRHIFFMATKTKSQSATDEAALARKISEIPVTDIEVAAIKSDGQNPNQMSEEQFGGLVRHIQDNGILNPIIVTESMILADGEHRVKAAKKLGMQTVPGRIIPDDDRLRRILRQTMNKIRGKHDQALDAAEFEALIDSDGMKRQHLTELLKAVPEPEEYVHIISNGRYDYYTFIPVFNDLVGKIEELWGSTWTMNRNNAEDLLHRFDIGLIKSIHVITGIYFKRRETAVYATLVQGLAKRGQHYNSTENHAKVLLIRTEDNRYFVIEGSANWTANPRIEQNIVVQSKTLYDFHKSWTQTYFNQDKKQNQDSEEDLE